MFLNIRRPYSVDKDISIESACHPIPGTPYWKARLTVRHKKAGKQGFFELKGARDYKTEDEAIDALEKTVAVGGMHFERILKLD